MSKLERLCLTGFRSYSSKDFELIEEFFSPVTLLLGRNGSGKSTVLEVLRFLLCGSYPPSTANGRAFLRDPALDSQSETKACAKLVFRTVGGQRFLCSRSVKLARGLKKDLFAHMEQYLSYLKDENQHVVISQKAAEIDLNMPRLLGTTKALVENVLLCH